MKKIGALLLFVIILSCFHSKAAHILGGNLTYECLGEGEYVVSLTVYLDCFGNPGATVEENVFFFPQSEACTVPFSLPMPLVSEIEISDVPADELDQTSCNGGIEAGVIQTVYRDTLILGSSCKWDLVWASSDWYFFENVDNTSLPTAYFKTTVDTGVTCGSSVSIMSNGAPFICTSDSVVFSIDVDNPDAYFLVFALAPILTSEGEPVTYESGFGGDQPVPGVLIETNTGILSFAAPEESGHYAFGIQVDMHNSNGIVVGSVFENMSFVIKSCTPPVHTDSIIERSPVTAFPNPAHDKLTFAHGEGYGEILIFNHHGQLVHQSAIDGTSSVVNCYGFPPGLYHCLFISRRKGLQSLFLDVIKR